MPVLLDQVGPLFAIADANKNVMRDIKRDAFGNLIQDSNPSFWLPIGFAGGLHDADTGLVRFGWRGYDPDTGRFTAEDPLGDAGEDSD